MSGKPLRGSHSVIFRRPYRTSGAGPPSSPAVRSPRSTSMTAASERTLAGTVAPARAARKSSFSRNKGLPIYDAGTDGARAVAAVLDELWTTLSGRLRRRRTTTLATTGSAR